MANYSILDNFKGSDYSAVMADKFVRSAIDEEVVAKDVKLMDRKWWDYRTMHPTVATFYFFHLWKKIAQGYLAKYVSTRDAIQFQHKAPYMSLPACKPASITAFWKARMAADAIGVPYEVYLRVAFQHFYDNYHSFASVANAGGEQHMPYPVQLVSETIMQKAIEEWEQCQAVEVRMPESPLILGQQVWFRPQMEAALREACDRCRYPEFYFTKAVKVGAILMPARRIPSNDDVSV